MEMQQHTARSQGVRVDTRGGRVCLRVALAWADFDKPWTRRGVGRAPAHSDTGDF